MFFSVEMPLPVGPRHDPQLSARQWFAQMTNISSAQLTVIGFIGGSLLNGNKLNEREQIE